MTSIAPLIIVTGLACVTLAHLFLVRRRDWRYGRRAAYQGSE
jgi:hypothetical protein